MMTEVKPGTELLGGLRLARFAISGAFAAQGFGYAIVVTTLPIIKDRYQLETSMLSVIVLLVCCTAAIGSIAAGFVARLMNSKVALAGGLFVQAVSLVFVVIGPDFAVYLAACATYGIGLGAVDASSGMQGVLLQHRLKRTVMSSFFAAYTAAAIIASLIVSAAAQAPDGGYFISYSVAVGVILVAGLVGSRFFYVENLPGHDEDAALAAASTAAGALGPNDAALLIQPDGPVQPDESIDRHSAPQSALSVRKAIWLFGFSILFVFVADSAVSTWSTEYLSHTLLSTAAAAPLAYSAYQVVILITRLSGDHLVRRFGRKPIVCVGAAVGIVGFGVVVVGPSIVAAIVGFALVGVATGVLVPMTFSAAGEVDPEQNDRIISSMNTFNYVGAVIGGGAIGVVADIGGGMATAFLLPAVLLVPFFVLARHYGPLAKKE